MVKKNKSGLLATFGNGTTRVKQSLLKTKFGGTVELVTCRKTKVGEEPTTVLESPRILLAFESVESLDVVIQKLQDLREGLEEHELKG